MKLHLYRRIINLTHISVKSNFGFTFKQQRSCHTQTFNKMETSTSDISCFQTITEGLATVKMFGNVFYNPVQEFNRDLSIAVLNTFCHQAKEPSYQTENQDSPNVKNHGITILEAFSASGLRSIRYAKEVTGIKQVVANDISQKAVDSIKLNTTSNNVENLITPSESDAVMLMYQHRTKGLQFDVIDLDPYGCPSRFLDAAVQAVKDGGLLLVTATDMAVLAGNSPETCYSKYGAISLRIKCCHEMALRILLQCIESHANRYGRYIEPLLSLSADFYVRVFVKIHSGGSKCKFTTSKLSMVLQCVGCHTFTLQSLGITKTGKNVQFKLPTCSFVSPLCEHCGSALHLGGPIWSAPLHSPPFIDQVLTNAPTHLGTLKRIQGVLSVISEELPDCPLYYTLENLSGILHIETPSMLKIRSAFLNAGYKVSFMHAHKTSIKTNAPAKVIWDILRCWESQHPVSEKRRAKDDAGNKILATKSEREYSFNLHPDANPDSRRKGFVRFQENPLPYWGPGTRATAMVGQNKMVKSRRNQGKRKRGSDDQE